MLSFTLHDFNQPIGVDVLPPSLRRLAFGNCFDQPIGVGVLPPSLTELVLGDSFNQRVDIGVLPPSLTHLKFGIQFNQPLGALVLPPSLTRLHLGAEFDQPIRVDQLPIRLSCLVLDGMYRPRLLLDDDGDHASDSDDAATTAAFTALPATLHHVTVGRRRVFDVGDWLQLPLRPGTAPPTTSICSASVTA